MENTFNDAFADSFAAKIWCFFANPYIAQSTHSSLSGSLRNQNGSGKCISVSLHDDGVQYPHKALVDDEYITSNARLNI